MSQLVPFLTEDPLPPSRNRVAKRETGSELSGSPTLVYLDA